MSPLVTAIRRPERPTRFVILSQVCTGSSLLCVSLRQHPQILMHGEILNQHYHWLPLPSSSGAERFRAALSTTTHDVVGCKIQACHPNPGFEHWESAWDELFADKTIKVIHLARDNELAQFAAEKVANLRDADNCPVDSEGCPRIHVHPGEFVWFRHWNRFVFQIRLERLKSHPLLAITFESLRDRWSDTLDDVQRFLGVEPRPIRPIEDWRDIWPLDRVIVNYADFSGAS